MASCVSVLPAESLASKHSRGQTRQEAFYHVQQPQQEASDRGHSRREAKIWETSLYPVNDLYYICIKNSKD